MNEVIDLVDGPEEVVAATSASSTAALKQQQGSTQSSQKYVSSSEQQAPATNANDKTEYDKDGDGDNNEGASSIDTFTDYHPTALPDEIIHALCHNCIPIRSNNTLSSTIEKENDMVASVEVSLKKGRNSSTEAIDLSTDESVSAITEEDAATTITTTTATTRSTSSSPETIPTSTSSSAAKATLTIPSHTSSACESALLSSVQAPLVPLETATCFLPDVANQEKNQTFPSRHFSLPLSLPLSPLQLEGVLLAIQRHRRLYHDPIDDKIIRAGFFLGDGAGIGKGRQIAAVIKDSCCRGQTRHVWLSVSRELMSDAQRDMKDVGLFIQLYDGTNFLGDNSTAAKGLGRPEKGCLFLTYNLLVSNNRLEQIIEWCAGTAHLKKKKLAHMEIQSLRQSFSGCIIFDEAHKAKNLANKTKTAQLVLQLQRQLPRARVLYCSATGVSDVAQLAYAERLGLWNVDEWSSSTNGNITPHASSSMTKDGTQFVNFTAFKTALEQRGLGSMELLALELKTRGSFLARTLSWEGAEFLTAEVDLDQDQQQVYNQAVQWWAQCKRDLEEALRIVCNQQAPKGMAAQIWRTFWAAHQRFFKELAICAKIPFIAEDATKHIKEDGCSIVIGLQSTGDAGMQSLLQNGSNNNGSSKPKAIVEEEQEFPELVSTMSAVLTNFAKQHFPVTSFSPEPPKLPDAIPTSEEDIRKYAQIQAEVARIQAMPPPQPIPELEAKREALVDAVRHMNLPPNPLDDLIDRLGGVDQVAEMTGRPGLVVRRVYGSKQSRFVYSKRIANTSTAAASQDDSDRVNLVERRHFMNGRKSVAIISDAASTGISLHAAKGSGASHKRRVHYTIELPWSADKAVQQLGRSHRSGQESAPIYKLVVTSLGGERRFAAAVSKRLASLGALTKGDRRAATGSDMSAFDLDSKYGKRALKRFYYSLQRNESMGTEEIALANILPSRNSAEIIQNFVKEMVACNDLLAQSIPQHDVKVMQSTVLSIATSELEQVGLDSDARAQSDVRKFLNRLAGLLVPRQTLVFSLFMSTLNDVITEAKTTGEFEGTAEDIKATMIEIDKEVDLAVDPSSGAQTKLTTLVLDRGVSLELVSIMALEEANKLMNINNEREDGSNSKKMQEDNYIVFDDSDDDIQNETEYDDEWMLKAKPTNSKRRHRAKEGFYISKNKIAGRHLILFAKGKFDYQSFESENEAASFDMLGLMQLTRPNTGPSTVDMNSTDLQRKYYLACSCAKLKTLIDGENFTANNSEMLGNDASGLVKLANQKVAKLWNAAYLESNFFDHTNGLAPRRVKVALVNGPVLHILSPLEKAVQFRSEKEKALKIIRAQVGSRRLVGVRFPHDDEAYEKLKEELQKIRQARQDAGKTYTDEDFLPVCSKSERWASAERKTMKSFFQAKQPAVSALSGNGSSSSSSSKTKTTAQISLPVKRNTQATTTTSSVSKKKSKTMMSYFAKKK